MLPEDSVGPSSSRKAKPVMPSSLPEEVWSIIAQYLVHVDPDDERGAHEQWQVYNYSLDDRRNRFHPLKIFSQTCRLFSGIALPMLWRKIQLFGDDYQDMAPFAHLIQLKIALEQERIACLVESIVVNARADEFYCEQASVGDTEGFWNNYGISAVFPTTGDLMSAIIDLGHTLPKTELKSFTWRGIFRPPPAFYDSLAQCPGLMSFTLDLARHRLPCADVGDYPPWDDALDRLSGLVRVAKLGFGGDWHLSEMRNDIDAADDGLVQWLGGQNKIETLYLAAPVLYYQSWILPLWAKVTPEDVNQTEEIVGNWRDVYFGEPLKEIDIPYERAAKSFRPLLLESNCSTPADVLELISKKEELRIWQRWHFRLEGETKDVMEKVIAVLQSGSVAAAVT